MAGENPDQQSLLPDPDLTPEDPPAPDPPPTVTVEQLQTQLAEQGHQLEIAQTSAEQANRMLTQVTSMREQPQPRAPEPPDPQPDPETQPDAHTAWAQRQNARQMRTAAAEAVAPVRQEISEMRSGYEMNRLWDEFQAEHPQYKGANDAAQVAFNLECPDGRIPNDTGEFKRRIGKRMETMAKQLAPAPTPPTPPTPEGDRTAGLSAGSGARPTPTPKPNSKPKVKTFTDMIHERQESSPFF